MYFFTHLQGWCMMLWRQWQDSTSQSLTGMGGSWNTCDCPVNRKRFSDPLRRRQQSMFSPFQQWWQWCDNDDDDHDNDNEEGGWCGERGAQDQRRQHDNHSLELTTTTSVQSVQCKVLWLSKASVCLFCRGAINQLSQSVSSHDQSINLPERNLSSLSIGYQYYVHTTLSALTSAIN